MVGNIVCFGNSITAGGGLTPSQSYPFLVGQTLGHDWQVYNYGHATFTTVQLIDIFAEVQAHFSTYTAKNILIVNEISNEIDQGVSQNDALQHMRILIAKGRAAGFRVLFATTTPRDIAHFTVQQQQISANINDFFKTNPSESDGIIDWAANVNLADPTNLTYYQDGIHPTAAGAVIMADMALAAL